MAGHSQASVRTCPRGSASILDSFPLQSPCEFSVQIEEGREGNASVWSHDIPVCSLTAAHICTSATRTAYSNTASGIVPKMSFFQSSFNHLNFEPEQSSSWNFGQNVGDFTDLENNIDIGNFGIDISLSIHSFSYRRSPENGHGHRHRRRC